MTPVLLPPAECLISPLSERSMGRSACDASRVCRRGDKGRHTSSPRRVGGRWKKGAEGTEGTQRTKKRKAELRELHPELSYRSKNIYETKPFNDQCLCNSGVKLKFPPHTHTGPGNLKDQSVTFTV